MKTWRGRLTILIFLLAAGCRAAGNQELLERELRLLEDEIYHLEDHVDRYKRKLEASQRENASLRNESSNSARSFEPQLEATMEPSFDLPSDSDLRPPLEPDEPPAAIQLDIPGSRPPEDSTRGDFPGAVPPLFAPSHNGAGFDDSFEVETTPRSAAESRRPARPFNRQSSIETTDVIEDYQLVEITLNRLLTGGFNSDDEPGDDGIMAVVEPRNAAGQIINVPGKLSVVVLDPSLPQRESRVARWDFAPSEAAVQFHESLLGRGIHLELPWPQGSPTSRQLHLYVRYVFADGAEFRTDQPIDVEISGARSADRWTSSPNAIARRPLPPDGWEMPARRGAPPRGAPSSSRGRASRDKRPANWQTFNRQAGERSESSTPRISEMPTDEHNVPPRTAKKRRRVEWSPDRR